MREVGPRRKLLGVRFIGDRRLFSEKGGYITKSPFVLARHFVVILVESSSQSNVASRLRDAALRYLSMRMPGTGPPYSARSQGSSYTGCQHSICSFNKKTYIRCGNCKMAASSDSDRHTHHRMGPKTMESIPPPTTTRTWGLKRTRSSIYAAETENVCHHGSKHIIHSVHMAVIWQPAYIYIYIYI